MKKDIIKKVKEMAGLVREVESIFVELEFALEKEHAEDFIEDEALRQENVLSSLYELKSMYSDAYKQYCIIEEEYEE
jgi:hypothetical protein